MMGKTWGDDLKRLNTTAEEHAVAAHIDEALDTHATEYRELYDQDAEQIPEGVILMPTRCALCGYKFKHQAWDFADGLKCPDCGAITKAWKVL